MILAPLVGTPRLPAATAVVAALAFACDTTLQPTVGPSRPAAQATASAASAPAPTAVEPQVFATLAQVHGPWSALPFGAPPPDVVVKVDAACRSGSELTPEDHIVVIDVRGESVLQAYFDGPNFTWSCNDLTVKPGGSVEWSGGGKGGGGPYLPNVKPNELFLWDSQIIDITGGDGPIRSTVAGRIGTNIEAVWISGPGMQPVLATVTSGWFGAWMPGAWPNAARVKGFAAGAVEVADIPLFK